MVMSSDTLANVRTPVLLLELQPSSHPANGLSAAPITVELDRPGLTRLMASLDKANEVPCLSLFLSLLFLIVFFM